MFLFYYSLSYLNSIKLWTIADIRDENIKQIILNQIENDKVNPLMFDINFYKQLIIPLHLKHLNEVKFY